MSGIDVRTGESASVSVADVLKAIREARSIARKAKTYRKLAEREAKDKEFFTALHKLFTDHEFDRTEPDLFSEIVKRWNEHAYRKVRYEGEAMFWKKKLEDYRKRLDELLAQGDPSLTAIDDEMERLDAEEDEIAEE